MNPTLVALRYLQRSAAWDGPHGFGGLSGPTLRPGEGEKRVRAGETLHGWDRYCQLVAEAYEDAPSKTSDGQAAFGALLVHIHAMAPQVRSRVHITYNHEGEGYGTADEMDKKVHDTGTMVTDDSFNQSEAFGEQGNLDLRYIHDYLAHLMGHPGSGHSNAFDLRGELKAYNQHLHLVGCQSKAAPALFTEIIGQVCRQVYFGSFPKQKICILKGFDFCHVGRIAGYQIKDGDLV